MAFALLDTGATATSSQGILRNSADNAWSIWLVARGALHNEKVLFPLGAGGLALLLIEPVCNALRTRETAGRGYRMWDELRAPQRMPLLVLSAGLAAASLTSFQGQPDLIPLLQLMAWGLGWLAAICLDRRISPGRPVWAVAAGWLLVLALVVWGVVDSRASAVGNQLRQQIRLSEALVERIGNENQMQALSCLVPLVITDRANATPVWHLGPRFVPIVDREIGGIEQLGKVLLETRVPVVILVTQFEGNTKLATLLESAYSRQPLHLPLCGSWYPMEILLRKP
jgi:hypothetical protein